MLKINFSHDYPKLWSQTSAELVAAGVLDAEDVQKNEDLIEYDTKYTFNTRVDHDGNIQDYEESYYPLPKTGKLFLLIFVGNKHIPFCTLRRYTEQKWDYYNYNIGQEFEIVIKENT